MYVCVIVKKLSTESVQLIMERCSSEAREEPCDQLITALRWEPVVYSVGYTRKCTTALK